MAHLYESPNLMDQFRTSFICIEKSTFSEKISRLTQLLKWIDSTDSLGMLFYSGRAGRFRRTKNDSVETGFPAEHSV